MACPSPTSPPPALRENAPEDTQQRKAFVDNVKTSSSFPSLKDNEVGWPSSPESFKQSFASFKHGKLNRSPSTNENLHHPGLADHFGATHCHCQEYLLTRYCFTPHSSGQQPLATPPTPCFLHKVLSVVRSVSHRAPHPFLV